MNTPTKESVEHTIGFIDFVLAVTKDHHKAGLKPAVLVSVKHDAITSIMAYKKDAKLSLKLTGHMLQSIAVIKGLT
jgi:hypothetical protein